MGLLRFVDAVLGAIAPAFDDDGLSVVEETVEHGRGDGRVVVEDLGPVFVGPVGRDDGRALLIAAADDLEEQVGADFVDGKIPEFVQDKDRG